MNWSLIMEVLFSLTVLFLIGLSVWEWIVKRRDRDLIKVAPRADRVVNNWKYSGLPPR